MTCSTCGLPMVWSDDRREMWCAVYGRHLEQAEDWRSSPVAGVIRLDVRRHQRRAS